MYQAFGQLAGVLNTSQASTTLPNPQYIRDIVPGNEGTCILMVPQEWTSAFVKAEGPKLYSHRAAQLLNPQKATATSSTSASKDASYTVYIVKEGDNLYNIAKLYPGVSATRISEYNNLSSAFIRPGMKLKIPRI